MRLQQSLSGTWQFMVDPDGKADYAALDFDKEIPVPMPWQAVFPEMQQYSGYAWYRRSVELEASWLDGEVLLQFGAVDYWCEVYLNGQLVGEHEGGYTFFSLPIRQYLQPGTNDLVVKVYDSVQSNITIPRWPDYPDDSGASRPPFSAENVPHGKQEWYVNVGGIWQDVQLVAVPQRWIEHISLTTDIHTGTVFVQVELASSQEQAATGTLQLSVSGAPAALEINITPEKAIYSGTVQVPNRQLWDTEDPYLYTLTALLFAGDSAPDELAVRFGFREVSTSNGQIYLNGEPIYLLSALDQDLYADTIYTVPSEDFLRDQFSKAKALGLNCLRCHIKPPAPMYFDLADEMGLLVWTEIPSWRTFHVKGTLHKNQRDLGDTIKQRVEQTLREMLRRDLNHPSIIMWTLVNEDWGTSLPLSASDRSWVSEMYNLCKELDPTRLVVDNSACPHAWGPNIHVHSDIDDFHFYSNIPDHAGSWEATVEQFGLRPVWTYSSYGDAQRSGKEPIILSEFGNWGLPSLSVLRDAAGGADPAWFGLGPWWSTWEGEPGWPHGVQERFQLLGLKEIWGSYDAFAEATQWHQYGALKFEIEAMRRQQGISGYVITELADIYWESNGLLDFYRNPKAYFALFSSVNSPDVVVPEMHRRAYWDDEQATASLYVSHFGPVDWQDTQLRWTLGEKEGAIVVPDHERGTVKSLGRRAWKLPEVSQARKISFNLSVQKSDQAQVAHNSVDLVVYPSADRLAKVRVPVVVIADTRSHIDAEDIALEPTGEEPDSASASQATPTTAGALANMHDSSNSTGGAPSLARSMQALGYSVAQSLSPEIGLAVTSYPTRELLDWVREGGDLFFISRGPSPFFWVQPRGGAYSGSWLTSYSWVRPSVHKRLFVENPLGLAFRDVMPQGTVLGLPVEDPTIQGDILAGMVSGWVGNPAVHTVQFRYGKGKVLMTTFNLLEGLGKDPVATTMFHDLLDHLSSEDCQPTLEANY